MIKVKPLEICAKNYREAMERYYLEKQKKISLKQ